MSTRQPTYDPDSTEVLGLVDTPEPGEPAGRKPRRKWKIALVILMMPVILFGLGLLGGAWYLNSVAGDLDRVDAFQAVPEESRPQKEAAAGEAQNFLLLGSDSRDPENDGGSRSDTIIVMHINKEKTAAQLISIPRDTWVHVPKSADGRHGDTNAKINAAFSWGGVPLMVQTVEDYTGVRMDHVALVDFAGFKEIVDALGGVEIDVEQSFTSTHSLNASSVRKFEKGPQTMDGAAALDYARERYAFKDGDFTRIRHQQQVIKAILNKAVSGGVVTNPGKLNSFLNATTDTVTVDESMNMVDLAMELRHMRGENLDFYTNPTKGTGTIGKQSVVLADKAKSKSLFAAVRQDDVTTIKSIAESSTGPR